MASSDPQLLKSPPSSTKDLQQWLNDIPKSLQRLLSSETTLPVCIFKLPETITSEKPDCYVPQKTGLGPIHHFRAELYSKQAKLKLFIANITLKPYNVTYDQFEKIVQETLINLVPVAEYCYDLPFDIESSVLAWAFAIDALVLLDVLSQVRRGRLTEYLEDVMMVENQLPLVILDKLLNVLNEHLTGDSDDMFLAKLLIRFCQKRSPFKFVIPDNRFNRGIDNCYHLLHYMYSLIINHALEPSFEIIPIDINSEEVGIDMQAAEPVNVVQTAEEPFPENLARTAVGLFPPLNVFLQPILLVLKLPWDKIGALIKNLLGETSEVLEIDIPSVSRLAKAAKIEFSATTGGICDIEFDKKKLTICLPVLDLKSDSEVILRNLVAYEELMFKNGTFENHDFTEYVDFMCGIIDGVTDVKILREKNIILGDMEDEEIVKLFNGINKSSAKVEGQKSELQNTIEKVNKHYGSIPRIKVFRSAKKLFLASWKIIVVLFTILSIFLLIFEGVCQVYECKDLFRLGKVRLLIPYNSVNNKLLYI